MFVWIVCPAQAALREDSLGLERGHQMAGRDLLVVQGLAEVAQGVDRAGLGPGVQGRALLAPGQGRVRVGHRGHELPGIGMARVLEDVPAGADLHDPAQLHHRHPVADPLDHGHVVGDEQIAQAHLLLQLDEQVDYLGLDGDVQRAHGLVGDDQLGREAQGPGNGQPLALAPGKLVGVALHLVHGEPHPLDQVLHPVGQLPALGQAVDH